MFKILLYLFTYLHVSDKEGERERKGEERRGEENTGELVISVHYMGPRD